METPDEGSTPRTLSQTERARAWLTAHSRARRALLAVAVYVLCTAVFACVAGPERLLHHTAYNHYALLADAWLHGRQDLANGPPAYAMNNDFAVYQGKTFVSFPPLPAMLMLPFVWLAGSPEAFDDGQFVVWLAGLAPAILFLVLEKLRRTLRSPRSEFENFILACLFAFGSVYFFTAVEGTVWFAALVTGAALSALFVLFALDAEQPLLAGVALGCAWLTRPSIVLSGILFIAEALRVSLRGGPPEMGRESLRGRLTESWRRLDVSALVRRCLLFVVPIACAFAVVAWLNFVRYGRLTPLYFDHELLSVAWRSRMLKWGLVGYHYLAKNMGIALTCLPWLPPRGGEAAFGAPFKINEHGLALWFTTPLYAWILWPKALDGQPARKWLYVVLVLSALGPAVFGLAYQNSGWRQFGYRFSNDYSILLFALLAIGRRPMRGLFAAAAIWSIAWNTFGAITFDRAEFDRFYYRDGSQTIVYQPD